MSQCPARATALAVVSVPQDLAQAAAGSGMGAGRAARGPSTCATSPGPARYHVPSARSYLSWLELRRTVESTS